MSGSGRSSNPRKALGLVTLHDVLPTSEVFNNLHGWWIDRPDCLLEFWAGAGMIEFDSTQDLAYKAACWEVLVSYNRAIREYYRWFAV